MPLEIRAATAADHAALESLVLASFEPITWQRRVDERFGPLNGRDWRDRWRSRLANVFQTQVVLVGEMHAQIAAMASATIDREAAVAFIDLLAVGPAFQGCGLGRQMLRGAIEHLQKLGCQYVQLDCLVDNDTANALYRDEGFEEVARHIRWFKKI